GWQTLSSYQIGYIYWLTDQNHFMLIFDTLQAAKRVFKYISEDIFTESIRVSHSARLSILLS
ncbi:MAG: hypothetical protein JSV61_09520, partial [Anaerolineales bacterium]